MRRLAGVAAILASILLGGCGAKAVEHLNDAPRGTNNNTPADVGAMPDGFSNYATKCDHGNRVYVLFHNNDTYGSITVVAQDPTCRGAG